MENTFPFDKNKYRTKNYTHIDKKINFSKVESYICNPEMVAKHSFLPLIHYVTEIPKYERNKNNEYRFKQFKLRDIRYAGHLDSFIYKYYADHLNKCYNLYCEGNHIDACSTAYRDNKEGKSNIDFAAEIISVINEFDSSYIIVGDFKSFFDQLDHKLIKLRMKEVLNIQTLSEDWFNVYKSLTKYGSIEKETLEHLQNNQNKRIKLQSYFSSVQEFRMMKNKKEFEIFANKDSAGIPQGTPISAVVANVYSIGFDKSMQMLANSYEGIYRRYSDDFILVLPTKKGKDIDIRTIYRKIQEYANYNKLELETNKSNIYRCIDGKVWEVGTNKLSKIDYLGFVFDGKIAKMRDKSISKFYKKAYKLIKHAKNVKEDKNLVSLPYRRSIYGLYTDMGKKSNFISYAKRAQELFDKLSPNTDNQIMEQIENRKTNIEKRLGYRIHIKT